MGEDPLDDASRLAASSRGAWETSGAGLGWLPGGASPIRPGPASSGRQGLLFLQKKKQKDFFESRSWALVFSKPMAQIHRSF
jgi:hypothetical protein